MLLLAVTNHITQNIAAVPLLWIVPLSLYLITFILCFDGKGWYRRDLFLSMLAAALGVMAWTLADPRLTHELVLQIGVFCAGFFLACMFCHGELVTTASPRRRYLTRFYLMISLGGALGSVLVGVVAPARPVRRLRSRRSRSSRARCCCSGRYGATRWCSRCWRSARPARHGRMRHLECRRDFQPRAPCSHRATSTASCACRNRARRNMTSAGTLIHGTIMHGKQYLHPTVKGQATSYYTASSGIGRVLEAMHPRRDPIRVGVIGLGAGTIATYGSKGDVYRFYDINPGVVAIAQRNFSFLKDSDATIELALGDARLSLEREAPQQFDVLAIDAFSSDAIPVHLITKEAVAVYLRHMKPDGVIAFHVTNRYLNLVPVVEGIAHELGLEALWIDDPGEDLMANSSSWVLLSRDPERLTDPRLTDPSFPMPTRRDWRVWTDDFNNLVQVLK